MFVRDFGDPGRPAVLILQGQIYPVELFAPLWSLLAQTHRVLVPDLPGHGQSPLPVPYTFQRVQEEIEEVVREKKTGPLALVGYSLGGYHALALTLRGNLEVSRLVLLAGIAGIDDDLRRVFANYAAMLRAGSNATEEIAANLHISPAHRAEHPESVEWTRETVRASSRETFAAENEAIAKMQDLRLELTRIGIPVLIRSGSEDKAIAPDVSRALANTMSGARLEVVPGVGHQLFKDGAAATWASVCSFLGADMR